MQTHENLKYMINQELNNFILGKKAKGLEIDKADALVIVELQEAVNRSRNAKELWNTVNQRVNKMPEINQFPLFGLRRLDLKRMLSRILKKPEFDLIHLVADESDYVKDENITLKMQLKNLHLNIDKSVPEGSSWVNLHDEINTLKIQLSDQNKKLEAYLGQNELLQTENCLLLDQNKKLEIENRECRQQLNEMQVESTRVNELYLKQLHENKALLERITELEKALEEKTNKSNSKNSPREQEGERRNNSFTGLYKLTLT